MNVMFAQPLDDYEEIEEFACLMVATALTSDAGVGSREKLFGSELNAGIFCNPQLLTGIKIAEVQRYGAIFVQ